MTGLCFVDASVLVYSRDPRNPAKQERVNAWLDHLWSRRTGRTSMQVLSETYVTLRRLGGEPEDLWSRVAKFFSWRPLPIDESVLRKTQENERRYRLSWWDSMIVAAAQMQDCEVLLTEDLHDGAAFGTLIVRSPFTFQLRQPPAPYALELAAAPHRPRGRPRRSTYA